MKLALVLIGLLVKLRDGQTTSDPGLQSPRTDSFHRSSPDPSFEEDKRRGWGKRSPFANDEEAMGPSWMNLGSSSDGEDVDPNESTISDLIKRRGWGKRVASVSSEICDGLNFDQMVEKRKGWGKRDLMFEKRRGWGKRDLMEEEKRRGWGKRDLTTEKRRGWGKRDLDSAMKILAQGEQISSEMLTCPTFLQKLFYHRCLALKAEEILRQLSCDTPLSIDHDE